MVKHYKQIVIIVALVLTSILIYQSPELIINKKRRPLRSALSHIEGWNKSNLMPLDEEIAETLKLDDYINQSYSNGKNIVSIFIGYYLSAKKVGVAHDPLVCFPGQGWIVSDRKKGKIVLNTDVKDTLFYSSMKVQKGLKNELIVYWFQSYDKSNPTAFSQKISLMLKKFFQKKEDNAFVRISISLVDNTLVEEEKTFEFIRAFYPLFLKYIRNA